MTKPTETPLCRTSCSATPSSLCNAQVWDVLRQIDAAEAEACRAAGRPRGGGALHGATYPRKPHSLAPTEFDEAYVGGRRSDKAPGGRMANKGVVMGVRVRRQ